MTIKVFTVAEMVAAERAADAAGWSYAEMMETAGRRVAEAILARLAVDGRRVTVLVGPGNNGGDGLVAGRYLAEAGAEVAFYLSKARDGETDENLRRVQEMGLEVLLAEYDQRYRVLRHRLRITDVVVDALLGTGVSRPISGPLAELLRQVGAGLDEQRELRREEQRPKLVSIAAVDGSRKGAKGAKLSSLASLRSLREPSFPFVVAVDCPSGLNCDTGELDPLAVAADLTVTFAGPKRGHFRFPGAAACGELVVADIGIDGELPEVKQVTVELMTAEWARELFPARPLDGHKGTFGTALIIAGSVRYWGAPSLAARGALRAGAGLVALAVPGRIRPTVAGQLPEATYPVVAGPSSRADEEVFGVDSVGVLREAAGRSDACLVGPGLGEEAADFLEGFLQGHESLPPLVVDADGLNWLAKIEEWLERLPVGTILTPHPGEMARLAGMEMEEMRAADRVALAREKAAAWGHVVVLKGAYTVIAEPDGRCVLLPFANPILGTGGTGDVLAGVIVSLLAQGLDGFEAAVLGAYWHGAAGELAAQERGDAGLLASELADWVAMVGGEG